MVDFDRRPRSLEHAIVRLRDVDVATVDIDQGAAEVCYILPFAGDPDFVARYDQAHKDFRNVRTWAERVGANEVYLMCHGWNNEPAAARRLYRDYFSMLAAERRRLGAPGKVLYLAVYWPSIVCADTWDKFWERELTDTDMGHAEAPATDGTASAVGTDSSLLAAAVPDGPQRDAVMNVLQHVQVPVHRNYQLAAALMPVLLHPDEEVLDMRLNAAATQLSERPLVVGDPTAVLERVTTADDLTELVANTPVDDNNGEGESGTHRGGALSTPLQLLSVWSKKTEAGRIGARGGRELFTQLAGAGRPVHVMAHSFGSKLVLEALRSSGACIASLTLVQPAISRWAFSKDLPWANDAGIHATGPYASIPKQVATPVLVLYSNKDSLLFAVYPLAFKFCPKESDGTRALWSSKDPDVNPEAVISLADAWGHASVAAALGAHGPDLVWCNGATSVAFLGGGGTDPDPSGQLRVIGVKGAWGHGASSLTKGGWSRESVVRLVYRLTRAERWPAS